MNQRTFVYCPYCATRLEERRRFARLRSVCPACGFVHFCDPKVAVVALVVWDDQVLLVRRGVDPERGKWTLPGGYMDADEMPETALRREIDEEVGLEIDDIALLDIFPMAGSGKQSRGIVLVYQAKPAADGPLQIRAQDDVLEAGWFRAGALPLDLAFDSTISLLQHWQQQQEARI